MKRKNEKRKKSLLCMLMGALVTAFIISGYMGNGVVCATVTELTKEEVMDEYEGELLIDISSICYNADKKILGIGLTSDEEDTEIQIATNGDFTKNVKTVKFAGTSKDLFDGDCVIKGIKPEKTYYARVRKFITEGQDTIYGPYSKAYKIKTTSFEKIKNVKVTNPKKGEVVVTWKGIKKPKGYKKLSYYISLCWDKNEVNELDVTETKNNKVVIKDVNNKGASYYVNVFAYCSPNNKSFWKSKSVCRGGKVTKKVKITK